MSLILDLIRHATGVLFPGRPTIVAEFTKKLPVELWEQIFQSVVDSHCDKLHRDVRLDEEKYLFGIGLNTKCPKFLPDICRVSDDFRIIAAPLLIRQVGFSVQDRKDLHFLDKFLASIPGDRGYKNTKRLDFSDFCAVATHHTEVDELVRKCSNLKIITLGFSMPDYKDPRQVGQDVWAATEEERVGQCARHLIQSHRLEQFLECKKMEKVWLMFAGPNMFDICDCCDTESCFTCMVLQAVSVWMRDEFRKRNMEVDVHDYPRF